MPYKLTIALLALTLTVSGSAVADSSKTMTRGELASYISGRINQDLQETSQPATTVCDDQGCDVVVGR